MYGGTLANSRCCILNKNDVDEFVMPQQVQSCFSRMATKLKKRHDGDITEEEITAAEVDKAFSLTRATVIDQCQVADIQAVYFVCIELVSET